MTRRVLVSPRPEEPRGNDSLLDWFRKSIVTWAAQIFEQFSWLVKHAPDHELTESEIAADVSPTDFRYPPGHVRRYGAIGDNTTNDLEAIRRAIAQFEEDDGAPIVFEENKTYWLGDATAAPVLLPIDGAVNKVIYGNGARLRTNTTDDSAPVVVQLNDPRYVVVHQLGVTDDGYVQVDQSGAIAFDVRASAATDEDIGHVTFHDCGLDGGLSLLRIAGDETGQVSTNTDNRIRNVRVEGGYCIRSFYVVNIQNHGDDTYMNLFVEDVHRSCFGYGVTGLDYNAHVKNPRGGYAHILCKAYDRSTEGWRIRIYLETAASSFDAIRFEFQNDTQDESIRDIEIDINMRNTNSGATPVTFSALEADETPRTTTTNRWDNIRLKGDWTGFSGPFVFDTRQSTEGRLIIDPSLANQVATLTNLSGFVVLTAPDTEIRTVSGDLTASSITIPCSRYDAQAFELEVTVSLQDPTDGSTSNAATLTQQDIIKASNSGGGAVSILDQFRVFRFTRESSSLPDIGTVTYTASGENIVVSFSTHTHSSCHARVVTKHLRGWA